MYLGDFPEDFTTVTCMFTTHEASGAPVAPSSALEAADVLIYKNGSATQKATTNGVTMTSPFDSIVGLHCVVIDTSNDTGDGGFWVAGAQYMLVLAPDETVDGIVVAKVIGTFGIELSEVLRPTTAGRQLDVSAGGEAGLDWANIGSPTTAVNLSGTNIDTDQVVASVAGAVGSVTGAVGSVAAGGIAAASFAANAITAAKLDPDVTTELQAGLATASSLATVAAFLDTEVAAILADTNELQTDWADGGRLDLILDARASQTSVDTIDGIVDSILVDTAEIGAAGAGLTALATQASVNTIDGIVDDILVDTAEIGAAGAGLTNINLPDQTMNITGNITGNLTGSVGSVTGAVGSVTGAVGSVTGNVGGTINGLTATALKDFFDTDTTTTYASAVAGSVVKEIADNAGGASLTASDIADEVETRTIAAVTLVNGLAANSVTASALAADAAAEIADAVWDEDATGHQTTGTFGQAIGDPVADTTTIYGAVVTAAAGATIAADIIAVKAETATILADTNELQTDWANGGRLDNILDARASQTSVDTIDGIVDDILLDTAEIGAAGAGLTAINLPDQTMNITGNLSGSVGSVTGAVGSVTGAVGSVTGNVGGTINGLTAVALKDFFDTDTTTTYASAVAGSVVKEIADNAGGGGLTASDIADEVETRTIAAVTVVNGLAANSVTAAALAADAGTEIGTAVWASATRVLTAGTNIVLAKGTGVTGFTDLSAAQVNTEVDTALADYDGPTHAELVSEINAVQSDVAGLSIPTAIENADTLLDRDMATGADSGSTTVRTPRQALRFLRNKWSLSGSTLTVTKENDSTTSWTSVVTGTAGADPITASDPAGP